ncbi:MAG: M15 family metallopeptidase [Gammaproteobacteria bacterium]|nr:M15 family metallopeptidase [Gammaproteobacteria bacterium]
MFSQAVSRVLDCIKQSLWVIATICLRKDQVQDSVQINSITSLEDLPSIVKKMDPATWPEKYPVPLADLAYVKLLYWGFDHKAHVGALIVNKALAGEVLEIFTILYQNKFPIEQMQPIYEFNHNDDASMAANNTSAFNCREITGQPGIFSQHSYGRAIDINPKINPYVKKQKVLPSGSEVFVSRDEPSPGKITLTSLPYILFTERGWDWGGHWHDLQDYQHFEKREKGEKRNPDGYPFPPHR